MFRTLIRVQMRVLAVLAVVTLALVSTAGIVQALNRNEQEKKVDIAAQEARFWALVAGEETSVQPTVENLLARDLRPLVEDPDLIPKFRAPSNRYGGITDAIGVDPFNGEGLNCSECGPLSPASQDKLEAIADGDFEYVRSTIIAEPPDDTINVTPFGWGIPFSLFAWLTVAGTLTVIVSHLYLKQLDDRYRVKSIGDLDWEYPSVQRNVVIALGWPVMVPYMVYQRMNRRRFAEKVRTMFPEQVALVEQTDRMIARANGPQVAELQQVRDSVMHELEVQTRAGTDLGDMELKFLTEQLQAANEFLQLRAGVMKEQ